jgi:hypothetical protein
MQAKGLTWTLCNAKKLLAKTASGSAKPSPTSTLIPSQGTPEFPLGQKDLLTECVRALWRSRELRHFMQLSLALQSAPVVVMGHASGTDIKGQELQNANLRYSQIVQRCFTG